MSLKKLVSLASASLLLGGFVSYGSIALAQEASSEAISESVEMTDSAVESESVVDSESTDESATDEEYAFEVVVDVINNEEEVMGTATFREDQAGLVTLELELEGVEPGEYGMHIHEVGLATAPTFEDAGAHFNPTDVEHGTESETGPHAGDLPNLVVGEDGTVNETIEIPDVTLDPEGENTLNGTDGTTLIIHTQADDYVSQPTGDAGDRMLAAVIFAPLEDSEFYTEESDPESSDSAEASTEETTESVVEESSEESAE
ncbi:superoxide dismutase family protein [Fundicoccus culcitae]|uniref:Superoxide dismutase family protein n=1 Tax=Fundicoccus culcitae TaxID=2969821 RepID=A0ABY5P7B7_9LACT|nr:superoxide dismutase family protein [Fundicoccus culcitae]UUX34631.1 superoxide dismutase family protein [Fundicoccus culcitae]